MNSVVSVGMFIIFLLIVPYTTGGWASEHQLNAQIFTFSDIFPIVISLIALGFSIYSFVIQRKSSYLDRIHKITDRLYEMDKIILDKPEIQKYLYDNVNFNYKEKSFIRDTKHDTTYFKIKAFVYLYLSIFDEIFSTIEGDKKLEKMFEFECWKEYIIEKMKHPLFRGIYEKEANIFGDKFQNFYAENKSRLENEKLNHDIF